MKICVSPFSPPRSGQTPTRSFARAKPHKARCYRQGGDVGVAWALAGNPPKVLLIQDHDWMLQRVLHKSCGYRLQILINASKFVP